LHVYDFWTELNEHLLGHIFEESLSDSHDIGLAEAESISEKLRERKRNGIYYTSSILSDFLSASALKSILDERAALVSGTSASASEIAESIKNRLHVLGGLKIIDLACGSGAFLVSSYRELLHEFWRLRASLSSLSENASGKTAGLFAFVEPVTQASLLRDGLYGVDLLPQAVEIAKLALWLRSARKGEKVANLSAGLIAQDSLKIDDLFSALKVSPGSFDIVIGNPPWGGEIDAGTYKNALARLGLQDDEAWDSWELFLLLGLEALREGGRLALVLPDSFLYPKKEKVRRLLFARANVEKVHNLGPDWFGKDVRMGTIIIQARKGPRDPNSHMQCALVSGDLRTGAIQGRVPLTQIEAQRSRWIATSRPLASPDCDLEIFRGDNDDRVMDGIIAHSSPLADLTEHGRGEEMNKAGTLWQCPSCLSCTVPGTTKKGGGYSDKPCPKCGNVLTAQTINEVQLISDFPEALSVPFIDGDDVNRRFQSVSANKYLRLNLSGWSYKGSVLYKSPKLLVRQAGIGLVATLDASNAWCPQSVYIYRLKPEHIAAGYRHEFILAALLSRTMAYFVFKRFSEVDPAKAHAKLTHDRLASLPIPKVDFRKAGEAAAHKTIVQNVQKLLKGSAAIGDEEDLEIERLLRGLWGVAETDGAYINGEFADLPDSQVIRDLFPNGRPKKYRSPAKAGPKHGRS